MSETQTVARHLKPITAFLMALTALAASCTSLVKVADKSVEQVSYETLSKKIVELQGEIDLLRQKPQEDVFELPPVSIQGPVPSSSSALPVPGLDAGVPVVHGPLTPLVRPKPQAPPPSWKFVEEKASKL